MPADASISAALFEHDACGLLRTDKDGLVVRVNACFSKLCELPADALIGKKRFQDLLTPGGQIFHQTHWMPLLQMQGSISEVKLDLVAESGARLPVVVNAFTHRANDVSYVDIALFVARDRDTYERELLSTQRKLSAALEESARLHEEARQRVIFVEQMIGMVSHDLRNPLSAIQMGVVLLSETARSESDQRVLARVLRSCKRAAALTYDLLDFTQARLGNGIPVNLEPIHLHRVIADAVDELRLSRTDHQIVLDAVGDGDCVADARRLAQVVGNLVSNARAYGFAGRPIVVRSIIDESTITIEVQNEGNPISSELQAAMFEPLVRGADASTRSRSIGLGLFIVREIARSHGGKASLRSSAPSSPGGVNVIGVVLPRLPNLAE